MGGSASVYVMFERMSPSATPRAPASATYIIVGDACVGFDFSDVGGKAWLVSCLDEAVGFQKKFPM